MCSHLKKASRVYILSVKQMCCAGAKTHKTSELIRVVEKTGKSYTVKGEVGLSGLSPESRQYVELSDEGHAMCLSLEAAITVEEQRSNKNIPFFPITIGRLEEWTAAGLCLCSCRLALCGLCLFGLHHPPLSGDPPTQTPRAQHPCRPIRRLPRQLHHLKLHRSLLLLVSHSPAPHNASETSAVE